MSGKSYEKLNDIQVDALKEIGNIGSGNAATALSQVLGQSINISVPSIQIVDINEAIELLGGAEKIVAGVLVKMTGDMEGAIMSTQSLDVINFILENLMGYGVNGFEELDEMQLSAIAEMGNISMGAYINAISDMLGLQVHISVPGVSVNMIGGIMTVPMTTYCYEAEKIMMIQGKFKLGDKIHDDNILLIPEQKSLQKLLDRLGV